MKIKSLLLLVAVSFSFATAHAVEPKKPEAGSKPAAKKEEPAKPKEKTYPYYGQVVAVTSRTLTLKGNEKTGDRKFSISAQTKIVKDGKPVKADNILVGRWVGGSAAKTEAGNMRAVTINLSAKQKTTADKKPAAKAEDKPKKTTAKAG